MTYRGKSSITKVKLSEAIATGTDSKDRNNNEIVDLLLFSSRILFEMLVEYLVTEQECSKTKEKRKEIIRFALKHRLNEL